MPKPGGGGGGGKANFDLNIFGPPPGDLTVNKELWIDLGAIPIGKKVWFGNLQFTAPDKSLTVEMRSNILGETAGTLADTETIYKASVSPRKGTVTLDMYKNGRLHLVTITGTATGEKFWMRLSSKKHTAASFIYYLAYTLEG